MPAGEPAPTFEAAVLEPLAARVDGSPLGRVHPRRAEPFLLLVTPTRASRRPARPATGQRSVNGTAHCCCRRPARSTRPSTCCCAPGPGC